MHVVRFLRHFEERNVIYPTINAFNRHVVFVHLLFPLFRVGSKKKKKKKTEKCRSLKAEKYRKNVLES